MDWTESGIRNTFEYELVDCETLEHVGWLEGVKGGKVMRDYRADYRTSGTLDFDGDSIPDHCAIRIWHNADLLGESFREIIATLFPEPSDMNLIYGRYTGSVTLYGPMKALATDIRSGDYGVAAGTSIKSHFSNRVAGSRRRARVLAFAANSVFGDYHVWESSTSVLAECQACADACGGYINEDDEGYVVLEPYALPSARADSFSIPTGSASLTLLGVAVSSAEIVNRVVCTYETTNDGVASRISRSARVAASHPWSPERIGRWETEDYHPPAIQEGADVGTALQQFADQRLAERSNTKRTFSTTMLYMPSVRMGATGRFPYADSVDGETLDVRCFVSQQEITLDKTMEMRLTLEEV